MGSRDHNFYNEAYQRQGYADLALEVQRLWLDRRRDEAVALIPDRVAEQLNLLGTDDMVRDRIRRYSEVFDRGMALAQQAFAPEHLVKIELRYAIATKARPEWKGHR